MAEFIKYTRSAGGGTAVVYLNVAHVNSAVYDQQTGDLRITTAQGNAETISGQQAKEALEVLNRFTGNRQ